MPAKKLKPQQNNNLLSYLKSPAFLEVLKYLESQHPVRKGLPIGATMEQRAMYQIRSEEFERIVRWLTTLATESKLSTLESTYQNKETK